MHRLCSPEVGHVGACTRSTPFSRRSPALPSKEPLACQLVLPQIRRDPDRYHSPMSSRLDRSWKVIASPSTPSVDRCVDIFTRPDGTFGFEEFRRDPEDMGTWSPVACFSGLRYDTEDEAVAAARESVRWLGEVLDNA
jgi:hypothetical protein